MSTTFLQRAAAWPCCRKNRYWWWVAMCLSISMIIVTLFNTLDMWPSAWSSTEVVDVQKCKWSEHDPVVFQMRTKTNVFYDAGQWYHTTENFLIQHSVLRAQNALASATHVYLNFDDDDFIKGFSGVTRLMVFLGVASGRPSTHYVHYLDAQELPLERFQPDDGILVPRSSLTQGQVIDVSVTVPTDQRFMTVLSAKDREVSPAVNTPGSVCLRFMGAIGGTLRRKGEWFTNEGDVASLRRKMRHACPYDPKLMASMGKKKKHKLVLYQRDKTRRLMNQDETLRLLREKLPESEWDIILFVHDNFVSPCVLMHLLSDADVLLTPHGFQSILLLFLPIPAIFFEVFPSHYHRRVYGLVAEEYGLVHGYSMSVPTFWHTQLLLPALTTAQCGHYFICRSYARSQDVVMAKTDVDALWRVISSHAHRLDPVVGGNSTTKRDFIYA